METPRTLTARKLTGRFDVVPASIAPEQRRPNQVTQDELDELVELYMGIEWGYSDLKIDTSGIADPAQAARLREATLADLIAVMQMPAGRALVARLAEPSDGTSHPVAIRPRACSWLPVRRGVALYHELARAALYDEACSDASPSRSPSSSWPSPRPRGRAPIEPPPRSSTARA